MTATRIFRQKHDTCQDNDWVKRRIDAWIFFEFEFDTIDNRLFVETRQTGNNKTPTQRILASIKEWADTHEVSFDPFGCTY
jgi:hypothetical protein